MAGLIEALILVASSGGPAMLPRVGVMKRLREPIEGHG
jgi:hypothetical protein